jgi:hypothetical protein
MKPPKSERNPLEDKGLNQSSGLVCTPVCTESSKQLPDDPHFGLQIDPDLARILDAWPALAPAIRRAMLALVESASG